ITSGGSLETQRERISSLMFGPACSITFTSGYSSWKSVMTSFHQESPYPPTKYWISKSPDISPSDSSPSLAVSASSPPSVSSSASVPFASSEEQATMKTEKSATINRKPKRLFQLTVISPFLKLIKMHSIVVIKKRDIC